MVGTQEQGMVVHRGTGYGGTQRSRVWWVHRSREWWYTEEQGMVVHRGAGYGGYTEEQGMVGTQWSRVWGIDRGAGYGGYTEVQGVVGTQWSRVWGIEGHSIISGVSACFISSDPDAFTHICLSLGECYFNRLLC